MSRISPKTLMAEEMESSAGLDQAHALLFQWLRLVFFFLFFSFFWVSNGLGNGPKHTPTPKKKNFYFWDIFFTYDIFFFFFEKVLLMTLTLIIIIFLSLILGFWYK